MKVLILQRGYAGKSYLLFVYVHGTQFYKFFCDIVLPALWVQRIISTCREVLNAVAYTHVTVTPTAAKAT